MKIGDICAAPCFPHASNFEIPTPGCDRAQLRFASDGRDYYAVLLKNHDLTSVVQPNPRLAIVGLSPAGNQIDEFIQAYRATSNYAAASIAGAFAGLAQDIIAMINGLGIADALGLHFNDLLLARHSDIYVTSLVACASLGTNGSSDDFNPQLFSGARRCMGERFVREMLNPAFSRLSHILILGSKGWSAVKGGRTPENTTILEELRGKGKVVLNLPHPSGQNQEYVKLASLPAKDMPTLENYVSERWREYSLKPPRARGCFGGDDDREEWEGVPD